VFPSSDLSLQYFAPPKWTSFISTVGAAGVQGVLPSEGVLVPLPPEEELSGGVLVLHWAKASGSFDGWHCAAVLSQGHGQGVGGGWPSHGCSGSTQVQGSASWVTSPSSSLSSGLAVHSLPQSQVGSPFLPQVCNSLNEQGPMQVQEPALELWHLHGGSSGTSPPPLLMAMESGSWMAFAPRGSVGKPVAGSGLLSQAMK
jgi:hypothetical protein